jgi:NADH-quinone oxidoreductase subunit N
MMLTAVAVDMILLFLALETFSIALYVLSGFARDERESQEAGLKYFLMGAFASAFLLYGIALIYAATGTTNLIAIGQHISGTPIGPTADFSTITQAFPHTLWIGFALALSALCFKIALVPFHQWTPDVYMGAPVSVTGFMAAGTKAAAFAALVRYLWTGFPALETVWVPALAAIALLSMFLGNLSALFQSDMKRMLGYSAVAHGGYVLVAVIAGPPNGIGAAVFYLLAYAFMNLGAFGVLAAIGPILRDEPAADQGPESARAVRDASSLADLRGLANNHLSLATALTIFLVSLTGIPPMAGFIGKWYIVSAAVDSWLVILAAAVVINSVLSALYYLRPVLVMFVESPSKSPSERQLRERPILVPSPLAAAIAVCAAATLLAIVFSGPLVSAADSADSLIQYVASAAVH